tara:strand:- start:2111 stop:4750 length:2640 start_codon:yes stop_codon:yes gene_type:complete
MATNTEKIVVQVVVQGQKDLDKLEKRTGGVTRGFGKMAAGITAAVVAFRTINQVIGGAIRSFRDFEFQMAKVRAVTGASDKDFKVLSKTAKELGRSTFFTAQQVAELQTNFGKLGFSTQEILDAQEATLLLATATDTDLGRAAVVAGASVRGFGLDASETGRIVDVMAVAFRSSALDIEKFQTSMTKVAPIAAGAGISMEATTAVMGTLTDAGIEASIAGTSLRNIFLKMQDSSSDLSRHLGFTVQSGDDLQRALNKLNDQALDNEEIMKLVDLRQVAAFRTMIEGSARIQQLTTDFNGANGEAKRMADIVGDTLEGSFKRLTSATQGLAIELTEKLGSGMKDLVNNLAEFFNKMTDNADAIAGLIKNVVKVIKWLGIWKLGTMAVQAAQVALTSATISATAAVTSFTRALARTGVGLAIVLLSQYLAKWLLVDEAASDAAESIDKAAEEQRIMNARTQEFNKLINQQIGNTIKQSKKIIDDLKFQRALKESVIQSEKVGLRKLSDEQRKLHKEEINRLTERINLEEANLGELKKIKQDEKREGRSLIVQKEKELDIAKRLPETTRQEIRVKNRKIKAIKDEIAELNNLGIETKKVEEAKKATLDIDREILDFKLNQMIQGQLTEKEAADVRRELIQQEINDLRLLLNQLVISAEERERIMASITDKEKELGQQASKDKKSALEQDIVTASLSGQNAEQAVKSVIRARIMEAVATQIAQIIKTIPFPANLLIGATAGIMISKLVDRGMAMIPDEFGNGGIVDKYANGGMVHGRSHANGGEKFAVGGRVVELEGGEAVINKRSTAMFRNQLSAMNSAGGGVKFADGGLLNMPSFTQQQFNAVGQSQMMGAMNQQSKVVVVEADITQAQQSVNVIESQVTF